MEAQRRVPGDEKFGMAGLYVVGGHVLQTEISAAGVTHRIVHSWPDVVGMRASVDVALTAAAFSMVVALLFV